MTRAASAELSSPSPRDEGVGRDGKRGSPGSQSKLRTPNSKEAPSPKFQGSDRFWNLKFGIGHPRYGQISADASAPEEFPG